MHPRSYTYASTAIGGVAENMACKMVHGRDRLSSVIVLNIIGSQLQRSHTAITSPVPVVITGETARRSPLRRRRHRTAVSESRLASHAFGWICCLVCSSCGVRSCVLTTLSIVYPIHTLTEAIRLRALSQVGSKGRTPSLGRTSGASFCGCALWSFRPQQCAGLSLADR